MKMVKNSLLLVLIMGLSACMTIGSEFPITPIFSIENNKTTRADIEREFGRPWRTGVEDGKNTWTFAHYRYSIFSGTKTRDLLIRYDQHGIVDSYQFNSTYPEDERK